jgi:hypothetical protein
MVIVTSVFLGTVILVFGCSTKPADIQVIPKQVAFTRLGATALVKAEVFDKKGRLLKDCNLLWISSNSSVAEVDSEGVILAKGKGVAIISVSCGSISDEILVNVQPIGSIRVVPESMTLFQVGHTQKLEAQVLDEEGSPVEGISIVWSSANPVVAIVSDSGLITSVSRGETEVIAEVLDRQASTHITVLQVDLPDELVEMIRKCLTCKGGSVCKVAVRDESFFYILEIVDDSVKLVDLVENKGQSVWEINDELGKRGWEVCQGVWVYGGKFSM